MGEVTSLNSERMKRMTTSQQLNHIEYLIDKLNHFTIMSAKDMLDTLRANHKHSDKTAGIYAHLLYVGFLTCDEGAFKSGDELLSMVDENPARYQTCLYRKLKSSFPDHPDLLEMNPLKPVK